MLTLANISFQYPSGLALDQINLTLPAGAFVGLLGPNGCGKSTLLRILSGLAQPTTGTYQIDDQLITAEWLKQPQQRQALHQKIGFVFQNSDLQLFNATVNAEVAYGPQQLGLAPTVVAHRVADCLALTGCTDLKDRIPYQLSGGEKKRVALASVLALNPQVLLLDEPLNGLTAGAQQQMLTLLQQLQQAGKTIIMASHNFQQIKTYAQRFVIFNADHTLAADLTAKALQAQPDLQAKLALL